MGIRTCAVLVIGCGPVGAVLAARLGTLGVDTVVVERATEPHPLPRAVAADDEVQHLLDLTAPGLLAGAVQDVPVRLRSPTGPLGEICFPAGPSGHSGLVLFAQPELERRLRPVVAALVDVRLGVGVTALAQDATGVTIALDDGSRVRAAYVVGCDGASSTVRGLAGIAWRGRDLARWLVVDVRGDVGRDGLTYSCDPAGPRVDMPLPDGHRWEWLLREGEPAPDAAQALAADGVGDGVEIVRAVAYRYGARRASTWRAGRVLLAGDAAHTMPPFAGQGLGAGVRDAFALAGILAAGSDLDAYQRLRAPHVRAMTRLSLLLGAVVETRSAPAAAVRDRALRTAFHAPVLGPWLARGGPRRTASGVLRNTTHGRSS